MNDSENREYHRLCCEYVELTEDKHSTMREISKKEKEIEDFKKRTLESHGISQKEWSDFKNKCEEYLRPKNNVHIDTVIIIDNLSIDNPTKPCDHLKKSDVKPWCDGIEYFWQDCCKTDNQYKVDSACYDNNLINKQIEERIKHEKMHENLLKNNYEFGC